MLVWLSLVTASYPLWWAWRANRRTTLAHSVVWALAAWAAWVVAGFLAQNQSAGAVRLVSYVALCLTGCTAIAVLGARRPGVTAWNLVILGLLAILLLPIAEGRGDVQADGVRAVFLAGTLTVGALNFLPTRFWPAVLLLAAGGAMELSLLLGGEGASGLEPWGRCLLAAGPWAALAQAWRRSKANSEFDLVWLACRDRFGLFWSQRAREQFNRAAEHAGWAVVLRWGGLRWIPGADRPEERVRDEMTATLRAMLKRFE
jgi:hypothetical protein